MKGTPVMAAMPETAGMKATVVTQAAAVMPATSNSKDDSK